MNDYQTTTAMATTRRMRVVAVLALTLAACDTGDKSRRQPPPAPSTRPAPSTPPLARSGPCNPQTAPNICGSAPTRYTLAQARTWLVSRSDAKTFAFTRYEHRPRGRAQVANMCEWNTIHPGKWPNEQRVAYTPWQDLNKRATSGTLHTYSQVAIIYPSPHSAQSDMARLRPRCQVPYKDTVRQTGGWTHYRRTQRIICPDKLTDCGIITDIIRKDNAIIATTYSRVTGIAPFDMAKATHTANQLLSRLLAKVQK